ncbi:hypothetical protein J3B02_006231, partial [Coemansia erecta]
ITVPRIGLGLMGMSAMYGPASDDESVKVLNHAIDIGCTFWDTADVYGGGHNERLIAKALKERRNNVVICTKFAAVFDEPGLDFDGNIDSIIRGVSGDPLYVHKAVKDSLKRLNVDCIDLYCQHRMDPKVPVEETVKAMAELVQQGKVRYLGLSECTEEHLRRAYKVHPIAAVEVEYSPWSTQIETNGLLDACRELGVTVIAYAPLGRGFLTGQIRKFEDLNEVDWRRHNPRFKSEHFENNLKLVDAFVEVAEKHKCKPGQVALSWLLAQYDNLIVIPGTRRIKYLDENFAAGQVHLSEDELKYLREKVNSANIQGERY